MKKALIISCFNWYKARLEPIREVLLENGYEVAILIADFEHISKTPVREKYDECTYVHVPPYQSNLSVQRIRSHLVFGKSVREYIDNSQPDFIWLQMPPNNPGRCCIRYKKRHSASRLVMDLIDLWPESMPLGRAANTLPAKIWKKWRDNCIAVSDYVVTECDLYHESLKYVLNPEKAGTLHLFKDQTEEDKKLVQSILSKRDTNGSIVRFAYLGSMNNIIDIEGICGVIRRFMSYGIRVEMHAVGEGDSRSQFESAVAGTGCDSYFYGPVYNEQEKIRILAPCDYAFNMMKATSEVGLTIKSIDYLSYGLPLINNIKGDTWEMVGSRNLGLNVKTAEDISEENIQTLKQINRQQIHEFFQNEFSKTRFREKASGIISRVISEMDEKA